MSKRKKIWNILYKLGVTLVYLAMILVLCMQAMTPGTQSSDLSGSVGDAIDGIVTEIQKPEAERVDVSEFTIDGIVLSGQTLSPKDPTLLAGQKGKLKCTVSPADATNKSLLYQSSDKAIAEVHADGTVAAKKAGTIVITVTSEEKPALSHTLTVTVKEIAVKGIAISTKKNSVHVGDSYGLDVAYTPTNTTERNVVWSSSDPSVASVSSTGKVKGIAVGSAVITVRSKANEKYLDTITITVTEKPPIVEVPVTAIKLSHQGVGYIGGTEKLSFSVTPKNATNKSVVWYSSNPEVATVSQNGTVTFLKAGKTNIMVKSSAYNVADSVKITVKEVLSKTITLETSGLTQTETGYSMKIATSAALTATLEENATVLDVTFASSDPTVVKIGQDGTMEGVKEGTVTITASTSYDGQTTEESFELTVIGLSFSDRFENFSYWVRKSFGHFGAFLVLGIFAALTYHTWFPKTPKGKLLAFAVCLVMGFAVAGLTEIFQLPVFTEGRHCSFDDVLLDFSGYCTSAIPIFVWAILVSIVRGVFHKLFRRKKNQ